jgi:exonuclease VII large subunit
VGSLDLPDQPDKPMREIQADSGGADRNTHKSRELPDPDERGRAYEAAQAHVSAETPHAIAADVSAETPTAASPGQRPDAGDQRSYWEEVPRFRDMWAKHEKDRSERPSAAAESSGDHPELAAATAEAMCRVRDVEPRLSADAQAIERENKHGGWLEGFKHRLKDEDRLKEKIAEQMTSEEDQSAGEVLSRIPDVIRYTYCFTPQNYTRGYYDIKERFESRGHEMYYSKNYWTDPEYKGINTRWVTPEGQRFEVQFHTAESFHAKHHVTHLAYERIRDLTTRKAERRELHAFQREVSSWIQIPHGADNIPDFMKEGF